MEAKPPSRFRFSPRPNRAGDIGWQPWAEDAFARARRDDKPILLALAASWCHWCHVMDETTYSDPEVIAGVLRQPLAAELPNRRPPTRLRIAAGGIEEDRAIEPFGAAEHLGRVGFLHADQLGFREPPPQGPQPTT